MTIILLAFGLCVVIVNCLGQVLYLGRASRTKESLPDFREWCRVTRYPRVFRRLTGCQRIPGVLGHHSSLHMLMLRFKVVLLRLGRWKLFFTITYGADFMSSQGECLNLHGKKCTCGKTLIYGFPFSHIIAACQHRCVDFRLFVQGYYNTQSY